MGGVAAALIEAQRVATDSAADKILSRAADSGTDFIVMGGFGHSPLPEFVLGVARGFLAATTCRR